MQDNRQYISRTLPDIYPKLWRFCLVLAHNRDEAGDLAQSTCERALEKSHQFKRGSSLDAWLFTIARNSWLNRVKSNKVRLGTGVVDFDSLEMASSEPDPETNIFRSEVLSICMKLPEKLRVTLFLVYVEGLTYGEAAEVLSIPAGTVMSRLAAARKILKTSLEASRHD